MPNSSPEPLPEPWLRGPLENVHSAIAPVLFALEQAREDLEKHTEGLAPAQVWMRPHDLAPLGFQLRHIAGSVDRLLTYTLGERITEEQLRTLRDEMQPGATREELLDRVHKSLTLADMTIRSIDPSTFAEPRYVGRKRLPTTVIGLLIHIAEHTQRHVGQAIAAAKLVRALPNAD